MEKVSNYIAISAERLEDIVLPELRAELEATKKHWLALVERAQARAVQA